MRWHFPISNIDGWNEKCYNEVMKKYKINLQNTKTLHQLHQKLQEELNLPEYYGKNLDALWDCITDMETPAEICISGVDSCPAELAEYIKGEVIPLFKEASHWFKNLGRAFEVEIL